jgi:hypothetical protein
MDIKIESAELSPDGKFIIVVRSFGPGQGGDIERMPKETLAIRAAEYNLEIDDPMAMDLVMLERFQEDQDPNETHPLYASATVEEALDIMRVRIENARNLHGAPQDVEHRNLFTAADTPESSQGLKDLKGLFVEHSHPDTAIWVKINRDEGRKATQLASPELGFIEVMKMSAIASVHEEARIEDNAIEARKQDILNRPSIEHSPGRKS